MVRRMVWGLGLGLGHIFVVVDSFFPFSIGRVIEIFFVLKEVNADD